MDLEVVGEVWEWRGPAPYHFVTVPDDESAELELTARAVTYGWGMIPVVCTLGATSWSTSLWPKDGRYVVPLKARIRTAEGVALGDLVTVHLHVDL